MEGAKKNICSKKRSGKRWEKAKEISCYLSSKNTTAEKLLSYTRKHWQVDSFHWLFDMNYDEDNSRVVNKNFLIELLTYYCSSL